MLRIILGIMLIYHTAIAEESNDSLRLWADKRHLLIGAAVAMEGFNEPSYTDVLSKEFNLVVAENAMKFKYLHPSIDKFNFEQADKIVEFATAHKMHIHGHNLVWAYDNPEWLEKGVFTKEQLIGILRTHIRTVVSHWRGKIDSWDVVNEAISNNGTLTPSIWETRIGPDYIAIAFNEAHNADPSALLYYNDMSLSRAKSTAINKLLQNLVNGHIPIHGVGMEMHLSMLSDDLDLFKSDIVAYQEMGLKFSISELDVRLPLPSMPLELKAQAVIYSSILKLALDSKICERFSLWGFSDKHSWVNHYYPNYGDALIFDNSYNKKPAYFALINLLR